MKIYAIKHRGALHPATASDRQELESLNTKKPVQITITRKRNIKYHRKFFALLNVGYDAFVVPDQEYKGQDVGKSFERFRKDVIVAAGYYTPVANLNGDVRAEAASISFASMEEDEFQKLFTDVANVLLQKVLDNYTREDIDRVVEEILRF